MESFFTKIKIEENMKSEEKKFKLISLGKEFPTISRASQDFIDLVRKEKTKRKSLSVAEIGIGVGMSATEIYKLLGKEDKYYCFDFDYVVNALVHDLNLLAEANDGCEVIPIANTDKIYDSYNWSLSNLLLDMRKQKQDGLFDIIYLDGAHTFFHDGLACCMLKELCTVGGYIILDDIGWSHAKSPTQDLEELSHYYTQEQLEDCQVRRVEEVFLKNDSLFRKISPEGSWRAVYKKIASISMRLADTEFKSSLEENIPISIVGDISNPTARIDIKNFGGSDNDVLLSVDNEELCNISCPNWFGKNGKGYVIGTHEQSVKIVLTCVKDGNLEIFLRGIDKRNKNGKKLPLWVDYTYLKIDDEEIFSTTKPIWHDKPYAYSRKVKNGEIIKMELHWKPHVYTQRELENLY